MVQRKKAEMARECLKRKKKEEEERTRREHAATTDASDATPSTPYASTDATPSTSHAHVPHTISSAKKRKLQHGYRCWSCRHAQDVREYEHETPRKEVSVLPDRKRELQRNVKKRGKAKKREEDYAAGGF
ncbi:hypothetical protein Pcinc_009830 [Petrolisthes cinctipes]|uniref:Uncharacterized protein n=1 Tax=Petrolisthes cinctipes TaxID=88211 RepID=A0AAE1G3Z4_PETCI|nr:hypothetical protein Pcinc_009830 [Petrolisthes cinctipes]